MLEIITYNIETGKNLQDILHWLESSKSNTDIICFQEFPEDSLSELSRSKFLFKYSSSFAPGLKKNNKQLGQLTLFDNKKVKLVEEYIIDIGHDDLEILYKKVPTKRSVLVTTFENKGRQFIVANVHLSAATINLRRIKQTEIILNALKVVPVIILGDFNYSSIFGTKVLSRFMEEQGYKLAGEKMITNKYKGILDQQLDYIFYRGFKLSDIKVDSLPHSDHYPVTANFDVNT